jgi:hypothetical protein
VRLQRSTLSLKIETCDKCERTICDSGLGICRASGLPKQQGKLFHRYTCCIILPCIFCVRSTGGNICPVGLDSSFSFGLNKSISGNHPVTSTSVDEQLGCFMRHMDFVWCTSAFHSGGRVHGIAKKLESTLLATEHAGGHWTAVKAYANLYVYCIGPQLGC